MARKIAFVGCQYGDEGKGKVISYFLDKFSSNKVLSFRYQGGNNAGHTVVVNGETYKLNQVPSAIVNSKVYCLLGSGMYIDPKSLVAEIKKLIEMNVSLSPENLGISSNAHITLKHHLLDDQASYNLAEHTSTGSGIKQTAIDKYSRIGIRFGEFLDKELMISILKEKKFPKGMPEQLGTYEGFAGEYDEEREFLRKFLILEQDVLANPDFSLWLIEGAQGWGLDVDHGQYPGVTSSHPCLPVGRPDKIIGVFKAYPSSVGIGDRPFVTEMDDLQDNLRRSWGEFGTKTGKPRHIGWFDLVAAKQALNCAFVDYISITCLDKLEELFKAGEKIKIAVAYELDGKEFNKWDVAFNNRGVLRNAKPIYKEFEPWEKTVEDGKLTSNAQKYVDFIEEQTGKPVVLVGTGPADKDIIIRKEID